jgi:hypothetical protein
MPSQRSRTDTAPDAPRASGSGTSAPRALADDAVAGDLAREVLFWRARAEELAARLARLEERLQALGTRLPARWAQLLVCDPEELPRHVDVPDPLAGWRETTELEPARVATALPRLWDRLDPDAS